LWSYGTGYVVDSAPAVANGVVYVGSWDHNLYALDGRTGAKLWSAATGSYVESSPSVVNGQVYVDSYDGKIYAFGLKYGAEEAYKPSKRPDLKLLRRFNLRVSKPIAAPPSADF
jgi:outer membrane protein assembly factor BamB